MTYFLVTCTDHIRKMLEKAGFIARIGTEHLFVSVHDAVIHAVGIHSEVSAYIYNCRQYCFGLLGLISAVLMKGWR